MFAPWYQLEQLFAEAMRDLGDARPARVTDLRASSLFFLLHYLFEEQQSPRLPILLVTETTGRATRMQQFLAATERLLLDREPAPSDYQLFPDFEPQNLFEYYDSAVEVVEERGQVLDGLFRTGRGAPAGSAGVPKVIVTSYKACWRRLPDPEDFDERHLVLAPSAAGSTSAGETVTTAISRADLSRRLDQLGYRQLSTVTGVGEYAVRGGLVDIFPVGEELPVRVDLFGDEIEQIHSFDPATQRTANSATLVRVLPMSTQRVHLGHTVIQDWLRQRWEDYEGEYQGTLSRSAMERLHEVVTADLELISQGGDTPRAGWYHLASASEEATLWSYLPTGCHVVIHEADFVESETASYFRFWQNRFADWLSSGLSFLPFSDFYIEPAANLVDTATQLADGKLLTVGHEPAEPLAVPAVRPLFTFAFDRVGEGLPSVSIGLDSPPAGQWSTSRLIETVRAIAARPGLTPQGLGKGPRIDRPLTVLTQFSQRLRELLDDEGLHPEVTGAILPGGFVVPPAGESAYPWTVITDVEIFGEIAEVGETPVRKYRQDPVRRVDELTPGDYVVHIDYGIGKFAQLADRHVGGVTKSFVEVEYAGRDRLFVPVEQLDRLRRYSYDGATPQLNSLGREQWKKTKEKVKKETLELAKKLLALYKTRQIRSGHAYVARTTWEEEFAEGFPFMMTPDQQEAWQAVEADMESDKPMDRLLVGDVGFGKTEISMRAAFKACVDERQVLVLCPTTILADQHHRTFTQRFRAFPFRVGVLSRFQSTAEQKDIVERIRDGRLDVLIATHRGLSKDVEFRNLGLLIIDEEQRFGVKQKEALKMRFPLVDVLAMSATPIPRSLHMSLIGLRDISIIETAPGGRKSVKTYVGEFDEMMVREAILRELGRGGQVYYLHNRVVDIEKVKEDLERLSGGEKVLVAHGQMREGRLEEVMHAFSLGAYKIMLATTIIENGLDIPTVNTIILDHAENLGLAQMHQLRGRVGRSAVQAFAYFFHDPQRVLTEEAQHRLHAIYNFAYLGAGYEIAQSDLRIRGAGNLLGAEQSGLARAVGFEYYCELLARSISDVRALSEAEIEEMDELPLLEDRPAAQIDLPLPSFIPEAYVDDPVLRLELLRDLAQLGTDSALVDFAASLADRFGDTPPEVSNLIMVVRLRNLATALGIERLTYNRVKEFFTIQFAEREGDWYRRASMRDSRLAGAGPQALSLALPFRDENTGRELVEVLEGLGTLRPAS